MNTQGLSYLMLICMICTYSTNSTNSKLSANCQLQKKDRKNVYVDNVTFKSCSCVNPIWESGFSWLNLYGMQNFRIMSIKSLENNSQKNVFARPFITL